MRELNSFQQRLHDELKRSEREKYEKDFAFQLKALGAKGLEFNITDWAPGRAIEFDVAHRKTKVAAEIQGGAYGQPVYCHKCHIPVMKPAGGKWVPVRQAIGHSRADTLKTDYEKFVIAQRLGWILVPVHPDNVTNGAGAQLFMDIIAERTLSLP